MCVSKQGDVQGDELWEREGYMGNSGNKDRQFSSKSVVKDFTVDALNLGEQYER